MGQYGWGHVSPHIKNTVQRKISNHWFLVKAPRVWGKQPKRGTSCSLLEVFCGRVREERESWWVWKGKQDRNQERRGVADCLSNVSFLTLSILWKMEEGKHTQKLLSLVFIQCIGNGSSGNFSCSFTFPEFSYMASCVYWVLFACWFFNSAQTGKYMHQKLKKYMLWFQLFISMIVLWQDF